MASIYKELIVEASAEHVWAAIRDVGAVHTRFARDMVLDTRLDGNDRTITFANGEVVRERIVGIDDQRHRLAYAVVEWRTTHHNASFQVVREGKARCRLVWITDLLPDTMADLVGGFVDQGCAAIKRTLEASFAGDSTSREALRG
jgi:Polyketide cyclase / dehydrase and lipid transport